MVADTGHREDAGQPRSERTTGEELAHRVELKAEAYRLAIAAAVGPLLGMADVTAFFGTCCDLMTAAWVELYANAQKDADPKAPVRVEILRGLCLAEMQRLLSVLASQAPEKAAGLDDAGRTTISERPTDGRR